MNLEGKQVVVTEDDPAALHLTRMALKRVAPAARVASAQDGEALFDHLHVHGRPDLILLDWNMPRKHGREVLAKLHFDPPVPVLVVTTSDAERDREEALGGGAAGYLVKHASFQEFVSRLSHLIGRLAEP